MTDTSAHRRERIIVIGAGPVGLASALLFAGQGCKVTVYEADPEPAFTSENSYPIGVNIRGMQTLETISPELAERLRSGGDLIEAFHIYAGERCLARSASGTVIATTRAHLTQVLFEEASQHDLIEISTGHRLNDCDIARRTLTFDSADGEQIIDAGDARVIAADGVNSPARASLVEQIPSFRPEVEDWGMRFRVAFSEPHAVSSRLDPAVHHIFSSSGIYTSTLRDGTWCVVLAAVDGDPAGELLLSNDASEENVRLLRDHISAHAPMAAELLTDDDCAAYFSRTPFGGKVVRCGRLAFAEWLVLAGDAAHSVIPPTGEGVNAGLEDARLLADAASTGSPTWFADFEAQRLPDLEALGTYASVLRDNITSRDPATRAANVMLRIGDALAAKAHLPSARTESRLFGPEAAGESYREALGPWMRQRQTLYPPLRRVAAAGVTAASAVRRLAR